MLGVTHVGRHHWLSASASALKGGPCFSSQNNLPDMQCVHIHTVYRLLALVKPFVMFDRPVEVHGK